jgi:hypothetical protein
MPERCCYSRSAAPNRDWAELVITEIEVFPKGRCDDLTDSTMQAIKYLREPPAQRPRGAFLGNGLRAASAKAEAALPVLGRLRGGMPPTRP